MGMEACPSDNPAGPSDGRCGDPVVERTALNRTQLVAEIASGRALSSLRSDGDRLFVFTLGQYGNACTNQNAEATIRVEYLTDPPVPIRLVGVIRLAPLLEHSFEVARQTGTTVSEAAGATGLRQAHGDGPGDFSVLLEFYFDTLGTEPLDVNYLGLSGFPNDIFRPFGVFRG